MIRDIDPVTLEHFLDQTKQQIAESRDNWREFTDNQDSIDRLETLRRATHRIKGDASIIGLADFSHVAAFQEELIDDIITNGGNAKIVGVITETLNALESYAADLLGEGDEQEPLAQAIVAYRRYRELPEADDEDEIHRLISTDPQHKSETLDVDESLLPAYRLEAADHLQIVLDVLTHDEEADEEEVLRIRRAVHSIKGGAGTIGLQSAADIAHQIETLLERISESRSSLQEFQGVILEAVDALGTIVEDGSNPENLHELKQSLNDATDSLSQVDAEQSSSLLTGSGERTTPTHISDDAIVTIKEDLKSPVAGELLEVFVEEAEDHLKLIYNGLNALKTSPDDREHLQAVRRSAHTLKGAAGAVGMRVVTKLSHRMEDLLDQLYDNEKSPTSEILDLLLTTTDQLNDLSFGDFDIESITEGIVQTYNRYHDLLDPDTAESESIATVELNYQDTPADARTSRAQSADAEPSASPERQTTESRQMLRVPLERVDDLVRTVSELIINRTTFEQRMSDFVQGVDELSAILDRLRSASHDLETKHSVDALGHSSIVSGNATAPFSTTFPGVGDNKSKEFDTLEFDRYNDFHILSRSIGEVATDVNTVTNELRTLVGDFDSLLARQDRLSRDTQDRLMKIRMVPLAFLTTRLHRAVRVVASNQNKDVELYIEGEQTELDKTVLEEIADPLLHLLRNAVDHGIEPGDLRLVKNKSQKSTIRIRAFYQGTQAVIRISDDGAGLNVGRIGEMAVRKGLLTASELESMTPQEIFPYIFTPGLSTAHELSEVSGRGVGMDIVRDKVQKLKGTIDVDSEPDKGTTFTIRLPLTLAVTRALMVVAGNELFAIPMQSVDRIARLPRDTVEQLGSEPVIRLNGTACPLIRLSEKLSLHEPETDSPTIPVLIVSSGDEQIAIRVERIIAGRDIVVKTLGTHLRNVPGLLGATLLGDGTVVPILDPNAWAGKTDDASIPTTQKQTYNSGRKSVMIVDDSVSVRRVMENLAKSQGWTPVVAKDGVDALEILQSLETTPDIFMLDVEMPRMDGYELLATLRSQQATKQTPIVMVTSRSGEKHRNKAFNLGASDYLVKPYQDETLIALVNKLTHARESNLA